MRAPKHRASELVVLPNPLPDCIQQITGNHEPYVMSRDPTVGPNFLKLLIWPVGFRVRRLLYVNRPSWVHWWCHIWKIFECFLKFFLNIFDFIFFSKFFLIIFSISGVYQVWNQVIKTSLLLKKHSVRVLTIFQRI